MGHRLKSVDGKLRMEYCPGRRKDFRIRVFVFHDEVGEEQGGCHSGSHPPLVEAGGHIEMGCIRGVRTNIGNSIQGHTVLRGPVMRF